MVVDRSYGDLYSNLNNQKMTTVKAVKIETSESNIRLDLIPGGTLPEINIVVDDNKGGRQIGILSKRKDLLRLKMALENVS